MSTTRDPQTVRDELRDRCVAGRIKLGDDALVIVEAATVEALIADATELRCLQRLIARLPDDDWQPFDFAIFRGLVEHMRDYNEETETSGPGAGETAPDRGQHPGRGAVNGKR